MHNPQHRKHGGARKTAEVLLASLIDKKGNEETLSGLDEVCSKQEAAVRSQESQVSKGESLGEGAASSV